MCFLPLSSSERSSRCPSPRLDMGHVADDCRFSLPRGNFSLKIPRSRQAKVSMSHSGLTVKKKNSQLLVFQINYDRSTVVCRRMASHRTNEKKMAKPKKPMVQQAEVRRSEETSQLAANGNTCALLRVIFFLTHMNRNGDEECQGRDCGSCGEDR